MSGHHILLALASALLLTAPLPADEKAPAEQIRLSVQNLGNPKYSVREQAARELIHAGESALAPLKTALASTDEEVHLRAETIVRIIQARLENDAMIRAPKIRLKLESKPLDEAIAEVNKRTGLTYVLDPSAIANAKQPITVDTGDVPYWEAVERFLAAAGLVENPSPTAAPANQQLRYRQRVPTDHRVFLIKCKSPPSASTGTLVRVKALPSLVAGSSVTKGSNEISFVVDVTPSPALIWTGQANVEISRAVDERDAVLAQSHLHPSGADGMQAQFGGRVVFMQGGGQVIINGGMVINGAWDPDYSTQSIAGNPRHVRVTLLGKEQASKRLKELSGIVTANVMTPAVALLTVDNIITASTKQPIISGNYQVQIIDRKNEKSPYLQLHFRLTASIRGDGIGGFVNPGMNGIAFDADNFLNNPQGHFVFKDANGDRINNVAIDMTNQSFNGESQVSDYVALIPTKATANGHVKLVLTGRKSLCVEVPFALKNVQMP